MCYKVGHWLVWLQVMRWMEQCAYIAASRVGRGGHLLTGSMDAISFSQPTRVGDVMYITAQVQKAAWADLCINSCTSADNRDINILTLAPRCIPVSAWLTLCCTVAWLRVYNYALPCHSFLSHASQCCMLYAFCDIAVLLSYTA